MVSSILIPGGAGFVGSNLAIYLKERHPDCAITCFDNLHRHGSELNLGRLREAGIEFLKGDVRHPDEFPQGPFELILECSAEPSVLAGYRESPDYVIHTNLLGTYHCLEKARQWKSKFLFLSTSRVYPIGPLEAHPSAEQETRFIWHDVGTFGISSRGVTEAALSLGARSLYGFTKFASEALIEEYRAAFGVEAVVNRCGVIAGPWQMGKVDQGFVALWVFHHLRDRPLSYIGYGGKGKQVRDVLHVKDLARLVDEQASAFSRWDGWIGNVSGGLANSISLCELTALCQQITGQSVAFGSDPETRPGDLRIYIGDCTRLFARSDWRPQKTVAGIVEDTAEWAEKWWNKLEPLFARPN